MPDEVIVEDKVVVEPIDSPVVESIEVEEEVTFEKLPLKIQKFVDQERSRASNTARERATRDAVKNPEVRRVIGAELEAEATLTVEQRVERRLKEAQTIENRAFAREKLVEGGIVGEALDKCLKLAVTDDNVATMANIDDILGVVTKMVAGDTERRNKTALHNTPIPTANITETKPFKEMTYEERRKLNASNPAKFKVEMEKLRTKI